MANPSPSTILYAEDFSADPYSDQTVHGTFSGSGAESSWQNNNLTLRLAPGITWRSPSLAINPLSYVRLRFRAKLDTNILLPPIGVQAYNKNNLTFKSINPSASWNLDPLNAGPSGGDLISGDNTSLINLSSQWSEQVFYSRVQSNAEQIAIQISGTDTPFFIDDFQLEFVNSRDDVATWADQIWDNRYYIPNPPTAPEVHTFVSSEQQQRLLRTLTKLHARESIRIILVGDSIVGDLANSAFDVLLERLFPGASISVVAAVGRGTGIDQWNPINDTYPFISSTSQRGTLKFNEAVIEQRPDLVLLGGISNPANANGYAAFEDVIGKIKAQSTLAYLGYQPDILIATGAFGPLGLVSRGWYPSSDLNATANDYRGNLLRIANENNTAFFDLAGSWGEYLLAALGTTNLAALESPESYNNYWRDATHANTFGKQILGRAFTSFFAGSSAPSASDLPSISLAISTETVVEDSATHFVYTFSRTGITSDPLTIYFTVGGTASPGIDYTGIDLQAATNILPPTFLVGTEGRAVFREVIQAGEQGNNGYRFNGIPDGIGVTDNGDGTLRVLVNHELGNTAGDVRAHGSKGAYVSDLTIDKATLSVISGKDFLASANDLFLASTDGSTWTSGSTTAFNRFCSADLAASTAFRNGTNGYAGRIFLTGEEAGPEGRAFAHVLDVTDAGKVYELASLGNLSFENVVANPLAQDKTVVVSLDDTITNGQVYVYVGTKTTSGNAVQQAGLAGGTTYGIRVNSTGTTNTEVGNLTSPNDTGLGLNGSGVGTFELVNLGDVKAKTGATLNSESITAGVTNWLRPEDGAWSKDGKFFYFVTSATTTSASRLWALEFTNPANPEAGGTVKMLLNGSEGQVMLDNMTVADDGSILLQEDPGGNERLAKIWRYNPSTDTLVELAQHNPALFGGTAATNPNFITNDEESSGIVDISSYLTGVSGYDTTKFSYFLIADQIHKAVASPTSQVEMGELSVMATAKAAANQQIDATANRKSITFAAGSATATFSVIPLADNTYERDESVILVLDSTSGIGYTIATDTPVTGIIQNDDSPIITITTVSDNVGLIQGPIAQGGSTNDTTPSLTGTISAALLTGETLRIYNGATLLGSATVNNTNRTWSYTPTLPASAGTTYNITARIADAAGNLGSASAVSSFTLDTSVPTQTVSITSVNDNTDPVQGIVAAGGRTNDATPTLLGTISAALGEGETLKLYNGTSFLANAVVDDTALTWSAIPSLTTNGTYTITARVVDAAGNQGPLSASRSLILDTTAPTQAVAITNIIDNAGTIQGSVAAGAVTNDTTPTLSGTFGGATDGAALATGETLRIYTNGTTFLGYATVTRVAAGQSTWSYTPSTPLTTNGAYSFSAQVIDGAGNRGPLSAPRSIVLDTIAPRQTVSITSVNDNTDPVQGIVAAGGRTNDATPTLSGTISAALGEGETLKLYNGTHFLANAVVDDTALTWSATPSLTTNGTYTITARVEDAAGNQGPLSASRSLILDTTAPTQAVAITNITDNAGTIQGSVAAGAVTNDTTPTLTGTFGGATAGALLATGETLRIYTNGTTFLGYATVTRVAAGQSTWSYTPSTPLTTNGAYSFSAQVIDGAGNRGPLSAPRSIVLDTIAPRQTVSITSVNDNTDPVQGIVAAGGRTNDATPTLSGTISAALGEGETLKLYNGTHFLANAVVDDTALTWSATPSLTTNGTYTITARVEDAAGNQGPLSASRSLILDTTAPTQAVAITNITDNAGTIQGSVAAGAVTNDTTPTLTGTFGGATAGALLATGETLRITSNGTTFLGNATVTRVAAGQSTWTYTHATPLTTNGVYAFTAQVIDGAGNRGTVSDSRSILLEAPISTAAQDTLTGIAASSDIYLLPQLTYSLLGPAAAATYDTITSFEAIDKLQFSGRTYNARLTSSSGTAAGLDPSQLTAVLPATWTANTARAFKVTGFNGTFVALNNNVAGFQSDQDAILFLNAYNPSSTTPITIL